MSSLRARIDTSRIGGAIDKLHREAQRKMERAALIVVDRASRKALTDTRQAMASASLGRLGNAIGQTSDLRDGHGVKQRGGRGFSASGILFVRSRSERTLGMLAAYAEGTTIRPRAGRWLWIPTEAIQRVGGSGKARERVTPANWDRLGLGSKIGKLELVPSVNGRPLLIVRGAGVALSGKSRSARSLRRNGTARLGQVAREFVVAFIGIPSTSRAARVDIAAIARAAAQSLPELFRQQGGR